MTGRRIERPAIETLRSVVRFERSRPTASSGASRAASVADLRRIAKRRLPGGVFDYIDGGAEDERTLAANQAAFAAHHVPPAVLRGIEQVDIGSTILGRRSPTRSSSPPPASPASPIPRASWRSPGPRRGRASRTRCRR